MQQAAPSRSGSRLPHSTYILDWPDKNVVRLSQPHRENTPLTPCGQFGLVWIDDEFPPRGGDAAFLEVEDLESGRRALHSGEKPKYFLRLLAAAHPDSTHIARELWREAKELHLIFSSMLRK